MRQGQPFEGHCFLRKTIVRGMSEHRFALLFSHGYRGGYTQHEALSYWRHGYFVRIFPVKNFPRLVVATFGARLEFLHIAVSYLLSRHDNHSIHLGKRLYDGLQWFRLERQLFSLIVHKRLAFFFVWLFFVFLCLVVYRAYRSAKEQSTYAVKTLVLFKLLGVFVVHAYYIHRTIVRH